VTNGWQTGWRWLPLVGLATLTACAHSVAASAPPAEVPGPTRLVEVWRGGDDGLTIRLAEAVEESLFSSAELKSSSGQLPGTLYVNVPSAKWKEMRGRTRVMVDIVLSEPADRPVATVAVRCWDGALSDCAKQVREKVLALSQKRK
jgi:hypothetical protein